MPKAHKLAQHLPVVDRLALWTLAAHAFRVILDTVDVIFVDWDRWKIKLPAMESLDWAPAYDVDHVEPTDEIDTYIVNLQDYNVEGSLKMRVAYDSRSDIMFVAKRGNTITVPLLTAMGKATREANRRMASSHINAEAEWQESLKDIAKMLWPVMDLSAPSQNRDTTQVSLRFNSALSNTRIETAKWGDPLFDIVEVRWFGNGGLAYSEMADELLIIIDDTHRLR